MRHLNLPHLEGLNEKKKEWFGYRKRLDPFLTTCTGKSSSFIHLSSTWRVLLKSLSEYTSVECTVTHSDGSLQYVGSEAAAGFFDVGLDTEEKREFSDNVITEDYFQSVGGVDSLDDLAFRNRCLSTLRLSLLKHRSHADPSQSESTSPTDHGAYQSTRTNALSWGAAMQIMDDRATAGSGSSCLLASTTGALCWKANIGTCDVLMDEIRLSFFPEESFSPVTNALLLQDSTYCAWAVISEPCCKSKSHTSVMASHLWNYLVTGTKKWLIAHPLDKYLLTDEKDGSVIDLWSPDFERFPLASQARVYSVTQHQGEALFIPSDAVYSEMSDTDCFAWHVNFVDEFCYPMFEYQMNSNLVLLSTLKGSSDYLLQFTITDLLITAPSASPEMPQIVLRGAVWCNEVSALWTELGVRLELAAFHECFQIIGEYLLLCLDAPHYVAGLPKGFYLSESDHHLVIHYETSAETYLRLREAVDYLEKKEVINFRLFHAPMGALPVVHPFASTKLEIGELVSYVPLCVLLNQRWPFEEDLMETCISLPQVILEKAEHPQGFVRLGSVWHFSNATDTTNDDGRHAVAEDFSEDSDRHSALFYCSPLFRIPVTLHPEGNNGTAARYPRIYEYAWNVEQLENYGMVKLLQFSAPVSHMMTSICSHSSFENLQEFLVQHGLPAIPTNGMELDCESVVASVLWILCSPCVIGFTCPAGVQLDSGEFISSTDMYQFQIIGLPSLAALSLLQKIEHSLYGAMLTRLCNWVCDIGTESDDREVLKLLDHIRCQCDSEVAEILEQIRKIKKDMMHLSSESQVNESKLSKLEEFIKSLAE